MTHQEFTTNFEQTVTKMRETLLKKGRDYANEDTMANFKKIAYITNLTPEKVIQVFIASKVSRMCNLLDSGIKPENESLQDSILDEACYGMLASAMNKETTENNKK